MTNNEGQEDLRLNTGSRLLEMLCENMLMHRKIPFSTLHACTINKLPLLDCYEFKIIFKFMRNNRLMSNLEFANVKNDKELENILFSEIYEIRCFTHPIKLNQALTYNKIKEMALLLILKAKFSLQDEVLE